MVGIPTLAVLIGFLTNVVQLNVINTRIGNMETRLDAHHNLDVKVDARFNSLDVKLDTLTGKVIDLDNRVTRIEAKLGLS